MLAGAGAFGHKHLDGPQLIDDVEVVAIVYPVLDKAKTTADKYRIGQATTSLAALRYMIPARCKQSTANHVVIKTNSVQCTFNAVLHLLALAGL